MRKGWNYFRYSFPVQLLLLHLRSHLLLLLLWALVGGLILGGIAYSMGAQYLFLDPEYLGRVSPLSFFILGFALGSFFMSWTTTTYILHSFRFPFLATLNRPFAKWTLNNALLPLAFFILYSSVLIQFQWYSGLASRQAIFFYVAALTGGCLLNILLSHLYFYLMNQDLFSLQRRSKRGKAAQYIHIKKNRLAEADPYQNALDVRVFFRSPVRLRLVRDVRHYDPRLLQKVFRQNHSSVLVIQSVGITLLFLMGALVENPYFRIPAGASALLLFSIVMALMGALTYWFRTWRSSFLILLLIGINYLITNDVLYYQNKAYGLNYERSPTAYSYAALDSLVTEERYQADYDSSLQILQNWRAKFSQAPSLRKPKMVFLCVSGGGARASLWAMQVLREANKQLAGRLMRHTVLMTGSSGGMLSAAYYRHLYWQKQQGENMDLYDERYLDNMGKDMMNALAVTLVANDIFLPWANIEVNGFNYKLDRGYMFERQLLENTDGALKAPLLSYQRAEKLSQIPLLFVSPVVINDGRSLLISPQRISYMMRPPAAWAPGNAEDLLEIDAIDFGALLHKHQPYNLRLATALRMSATYPFVFPNVHLPTQPSLEVMDAGFRDNFGIESALRFILVFQEWIKENTNGVVLVQVRSTAKLEDIPKVQQRSLGKALTRSFGTLGNIDQMQDYVQDRYLSALKQELGNDKVDVVRFVYQPSKLQKPASLSLHLTTREKKDIINAIYLEKNQKSLFRLRRLVK